MTTNDQTAEATVQLPKGTMPDDAFDDVSAIMRNPWDPLHCAEWDSQIPSATCLARIKR